MKKKALAILLSLLMLTSVTLPGTWASEDGVESEAEQTEATEVDTPEEEPDESEVEEPESDEESDTEMETEPETEPEEESETETENEAPEEEVFDPYEAIEYMYDNFGSNEEILAYLLSLPEDQFVQVQAVLEEWGMWADFDSMLYPEEESEAEPPEDVGSVSLEGAVAYTNAVAMFTAEGGTTGGIELNKTATANDDGSFKITLEAYATGSEVTTTSVTPADIVLVLDTSGSMKYGMTADDYENVYIPDSYTPTLYESYVILDNGEYVRVDYTTKSVWKKVNDNNKYGDEVHPKTSSTDDSSKHVQFLKVKTGQSKMDYLKSSVNEFISSSLTTSPDTQIAVVSFSGNVENEENKQLYNNAKIEQNFTSDKSTLQSAVSNLESSGATYSNVGMTYAKNLINSLNENDHKKVVVLFTDGAPSKTNGFSDDVANSAIETSYSLKQNGVTVYTIGLFAGANGSLDNIATDNTNKYMHYVSSNYPYATSLSDGGQRNSELSGERGYYLSATNSSDLSEIFQRISNVVGGATNTTLDSSTVVKDIIAPSFTVPSNTSDIKLYTANCTGAGLTFGERTTATGVTVKIISSDRDEPTITVTGFDFSINWCGSHSGTYSGKKLIIEFTVSPKEGFLGGNNVPTNGTASGVYVGGESIAYFEVPTVNVPIADITITATDKNVYLTQVPTEEQLKTGVTIKCGNVDITNPSELGDWQTAYVTISDTTYTISDEFNATADGTYTVSAKVSPTNTGDSTKPGTVATEKPGTATKSINVFKPELTYKDSEVSYGDTIPDYEESNFVTLKWRHDVTNADGTTTSTYSENVTLIGTAPTVTKTYDKPSGGTVSSLDDIPVKVQTVKLNGTDVALTYVYFIREACTCGWTTKDDSRNDPAFVLHVQGTYLIITKTGSQDDSQSFLFHVTGPNDYKKDVVIVGDGSVKIMGLPIGEYTVKEDTDWSWRYKPTTNDQQVTLTKDGPNTVTFQNKLEDNKWLSFETFVDNIFKKITGMN